MKEIKDKKIELRVTEREKSAMQARAAAHSMTISAYIRLLIQQDMTEEY